MCVRGENKNINKSILGGGIADLGTLLASHFWLSLNIRYIFKEIWIEIVSGISIE
ncbi:hypothetical protein LEQ_1652c [Ligilactobacillus equi DPC 6820]|uniref:Uncharacterized protein n=1 Tax=Ligilactobacillus equi DPC 6820 TaxID=1392007 RepID=V7HW44_9LACO|nr:hypothetical protein LEQ_1652c [Ligilactobacillus equi DPC 6820]